MNPINLTKINYDDRYNRLVNNIIYESVPQSQIKCLLCHSTLCNCDKKDIYSSKKNKVIYHSFNTEIENQRRTFDNNKNIVNINNSKIKYNQIPFYSSKSNNQILFPTSNRGQKNLNHNFQFYNQDENNTIHQNKGKIFQKFLTEYYSNVPSSSQYFFENNKTPLFKYKKLNNSVSGKIVIPSFIKFKIKNDSLNENYNSQSHEIQNENILALNKQKNKKINEKNFFSVEREKKSKFRKIYNIPENKDINMEKEKINHVSYVNIHRRPLNNSLTKNNKSNDDNNLNNKKCDNKIRRRYILCKKSNSNHSQINNNRFPTLNNISLNINNNFNYQINPKNILDLPQKSFEQMNNYYFSNFEEINNQSTDLKNIIRLRRKNITIENKKAIKYINKNKPKKYEKLNPINKIYINNFLNSNKLNYFSNQKIEFSENNKENTNINGNSLIKEKYSNQKLHNKFFEKIKKDYNNNNNKVFSKNSIIKDEKTNTNTNTNINSHFNKLENEELISLLITANNEIIKLQNKLNNYKKQNSQTIPMSGFKKLNNYNYYKTMIKNNINQKNSIKININDENINSKTMKNKNSHFSSHIFTKGLALNNNQILKNSQNITTLNPSKIKNIKYELFNNLTNPKIKEKIFNQNKYIFALYHMNNKKFQNSIICFEVETKSSEIKIINNSNFNNDYNESINQSNKFSNSIYLIKNNNYYIITGYNCNKFYEYNHQKKKINQYSDLKFNHSNGLMINYSDNIICLSGDNSKKVELFLQNENKWIELPEMQLERSHFSSCILKNRYLFAFFGYNLPNQTYINSIEYLDLFNYNIKINNIKEGKFNDLNNNFCWKYLEYNYFTNNDSIRKINLIGSIAVNINDEKIIFLGGKNCLTENKDEGYYQLIIDDTYINNDNENISCYIEKIKTKCMNNLEKNCVLYNFKYIDNLIYDNILKEPSFAAFDNIYQVHLIKLYTMNHEVYKISK